MNNFVLLVAIFLYWWQRLLSSSDSWIRDSIFLKKMLLKLKSDLRNTI